MNLIVVVVVSVIICCGAYLLNVKLEKKKIDKLTLGKMIALGACVGGLNYLILEYINPSKIHIEDFNTGNPKF